MSAKKPFTLIRPLSIEVSDDDDTKEKGVFIVYDRYRFDIVELPLEFAEKRSRNRSNSKGLSLTRDKSLMRSLTRKDAELKEDRRKTTKTTSGLQ